MPHYKRAPITEATLNLQARLPDVVTFETFRGYKNSNTHRFPDTQELKRSMLEWQVGADEHSIKKEDAAMVLFGPKRQWAAQHRLDGFTFNWLAQYDRWETFSSQARTLWEEYRRVTNPEAVNQIELKYVNRFDLPLPIRDFKDFFLTTPEVSPSLPQGLAGFFMQLQIPLIELQAMLVLSQTLVPPPKVGIVSVVLDIDLICANNLPVDDDGIWQLLERLRVKKNEIFEACITDAARELIR